MIVTALVFQIGVLVFYSNELKEEESLNAKRVDSQNTVKLSSELADNYLSAGRMMIAWRFSKNEDFLNRYDKNLAIIPITQEKLQSLVSGDAEKQTHLSNLTKYGTQLLDLLNKYRQSEVEGAKTDHNKEELQSWRKEIEMASLPLQEEAKALKDSALESSDISSTAKPSSGISSTEASHSDSLSKKIFDGLNVLDRYSPRDSTTIENAADDGQKSKRRLYVEIGFGLGILSSSLLALYFLMSKPKESSKPSGSTVPDNNTP